MYIQTYLHTYTLSQLYTNIHVITYIHVHVHVLKNFNYQKRIVRLISNFSSILIYFIVLKTLTYFARKKKLFMRNLCFAFNMNRVSRAFESTVDPCTMSSSLLACINCAF